MSVVLGCIADDFTGATDLANNLVRAGMRAIQTIGIPTEPLPDHVDAVVVALKSRTIAPAQAVEQSLAALAWLQAQGATQIYFKVCSTFDSTPTGNIGPVTEALMDAMGVDFCIATPAFPDNKRTVFKGHLFVGDVLLNQSGMQNHPLTPMTDANLVQVMQAQCKHKVGLLDYAVIAQGEPAITSAIAALKTQGVSIAIVDAVSNQDLYKLGPALAHHRLITAGSGVAIALPANTGIKPSDQASQLPVANVQQAIVCGSCSVATLAQIQHAQSVGLSTLAIDALDIANRGHNAVVADALAWAERQLQAAATAKPLLIYSSAAPEVIKAIQHTLGTAAAGEMMEHALSAIARGLVERGVRQLIVAGGETSGACVQALGIKQLRIGPQIDPGVPWCHAHSAVGALHITLKSGNFGSVDFFTKAFGTIA